MNLLFLVTLFTTLFAQTCQNNGECGAGSTCNLSTSTCTPFTFTCANGCQSGFVCQNDVCVPSNDTIKQATQFAIGTIIALLVGGLLICCCCMFCVYKLVRGFQTKKQKQVVYQNQVPLSSVTTNQVPYGNSNANGSVYPPQNAYSAPPPGYANTNAYPPTKQ